MSKFVKHGIQPYQPLLPFRFCHHFETVVLQKVEKPTTGSTVSSNNRQPISAEKTATAPRLARPLTEIRSYPLSPVRISTHPRRFISICCGRMFHKKRHRFRESFSLHHVQVSWLQQHHYHGIIVRRPLAQLASYQLLRNPL